VPEYERVFDEVLARVRPSPEEQQHILSVGESVIADIRRMGGSFKDVIMAGSAARGTNLRGSSDVDIFVIYPRDVPRNVMEAEVLGIGKQLSTRFEIRYAEHPYVTIWRNGVEVDIVPAYEMQPGQRIQSATDRTPLHQKYLETHFPQELKDDVRVIKAFLKGIGVYGAEIRVHGFSGYLVELLVLHYGGALALLRAAAEWKPPIFIDLEGHAAQAFDDPLVVIDPADPYRNVAAPVSIQSLAIFSAAAREFLSHPSIDFFFPEPVVLSPDDVKRIFLQRRTRPIFIIAGYPPGVSPDIVWGEIKRVLRMIVKKLEARGYYVLHADVWTDELAHIVWYFEIAGGYDAFVETRRGPSVFDRENSERFLQKHKDAFFGPYIREDRWYVDVLRPATTPELALFEILGEMRKHGSLRKHILAALDKGYEIQKGRGIIDFYVRNRDFARWLSSVLLRRPHWLKR